jgi:hypothetical protein
MATETDKADARVHWQDLLAALQREAGTVFGFGNVTFRVVYFEGVPTQVDVLERRACHRLGRGQASLTAERRSRPHGA